MVKKVTAEKEKVSQDKQAPTWKEISSGMIALNLISPSKTNPRKRINQQAQKELVASIREHGVVSPILLRPAFKERKTKDEIIGAYEIICGERRFTAAKESGLKEIPARVVEMDDKAVLEVQVIENMQRTDLHPLEEAEGYEALINKHGYSGADEVAAKVGKSRSYVYGTMKLCDLVIDCRKMFYEDKFNRSVALLIARIPSQFQAKAAKEIVDREMSYRDAQEHIHDDYMLMLKEAPFTTTDANLVKKAGACTTCQKRTGNQKELFPDIESADVCTDPACFAAKKQAFNALRLAKAKESGQKVATQEDKNKIFRYGGSSVDSDYVEMKDHDWNDSKRRSYGDLLKKHSTFHPMLAVDSKGDVHEVALKKDVEKALKELGISFKSSSSGNDSWKKEQAAKRKQGEFKNRVTRGLILKLIDAFRADNKQSFWPLMAKHMEREAGIDARHLIALRLNNKAKQTEANDLVEKHYKALDAVDCPAFAFEIFVSRKVGWEGHYNEVVSDFCKHYGIDIKVIEAEFKKEQESGKKKAK